MKRALLILLLIPACSSGGDETEGPAPDTNQIERLSTPPEVEQDPQATARLQPLTTQDMAGAGLSGAGCQFRSGGALLVATGGSDSIARIGDEIIHLIHSSPVGPSGGFFEDRGLSVSIGRTENDPLHAQAGGAPARATITNRRTRAQVELTGIWTCVA